MYTFANGPAPFWQDAWWRASQSYAHGMNRATFDAFIAELHKDTPNPVEHLAHKFGTTKDKILARVVEIADETEIIPCRDTHRLIHDYAHIPQVIVTSGDRGWALRVLKHLGLHEFFTPDRVVAIQDSNMTQKSNSDIPFRLGARILGVDPQECVFVDDHEKNHRMAAQLGIVTVQVTHGFDVPRAGHVQHQIQKPGDIFTLFEEGVIPFVGFRSLHAGVRMNGSRPSPG